MTYSPIHFKHYCLQVRHSPLQGIISGDRGQQPPPPRFPRRRLLLHRAPQGQRAHLEEGGVRGRRARLEGECRMCVVKQK